MTLTPGEGIQSEPTSTLLSREVTWESVKQGPAQNRAKKGNIYQRGERVVHLGLLPGFMEIGLPHPRGQGVRPCPWLFASQRALGPLKDSSVGMEGVQLQRDLEGEDL